MPALLSLQNVSAGYGNILAIDNISLEVNEGEIVTLIGANGAGKTTTLMTICGAPVPRAGSIIFNGQEITGQPSHRIARTGIAHAPEGRRIFPHMTVRENLLMGGVADPEGDDEAKLADAFSLFPRLEERLNQRGGTLSGGEQQMLAIARALMSNPSLLLLDEPSLGLAPLMVRQIFDAIRELNSRKGMTVLLVEQNAWQALRLAHRGYVLVNGRISLTGSGDELLSNDEIKSAYLESGGSVKAS